MKPQELMKYLCPFELDFKLKIFANRNNHDYAILFQVTGDTPLFEDPKDLEAFISQVTAERKSNLEFTIRKMRYDKEEYVCIFLDFKKEEAKSES